MKPTDWDTPLGRELRELADDRLRVAQKKLQATGLEPIPTEELRGRIRELNWLLGLSGSTAPDHPTA